MGVNVVGAKLDGCFVVGDGVVGFAETDQDGAEVVVGLGGGGLESQCFRVMRGGLFELALRESAPPRLISVSAESGLSVNAC